MNKSIDTARLIVTVKCLRDCSYCCNKYTSITKKAIKLNSLFPLKHYDAICITGGEPMDEPIRTRKIIEVIRKLNPSAKIYLYTARYTPEIAPLMGMLAGIHFTLHEKSTMPDLLGFLQFQTMISKFPGKSYRLYLHPSVNVRVPVMPSLWSRIESKPWLLEKDCQLPEGETLYKLEIT